MVYSYNAYASAVGVSFSTSTQRNYNENVKYGKTAGLGGDWLGANGLQAMAAELEGEDGPTKVFGNRMTGELQDNIVNDDGRYYTHQQWTLDANKDVNPLGYEVPGAVALRKWRVGFGDISYDVFGTVFQMKVSFEVRYTAPSAADAADGRPNCVNEKLKGVRDVTSTAWPYTYQSLLSVPAWPYSDGYVTSTKYPYPAGIATHAFGTGGKRNPTTSDISSAANGMIKWQAVTKKFTISCGRTPTGFYRETEDAAAIECEPG
jgi:hypothetical protein